MPLRISHAAFLAVLWACVPFKEPADEGSGVEDVDDSDDGGPSPDTEDTAEDDSDDSDTDAGDPVVDGPDDSLEDSDTDAAGGTGGNDDSAGAGVDTDAPMDTATDSVDTSPAEETDSDAGADSDLDSDSDTGSDVDSDTDADSDTDTDSDTDADSDTGAAFDTAGSTGLPPDTGESDTDTGALHSDTDESCWPELGPTDEGWMLTGVSPATQNFFGIPLSVEVALYEDGSATDLGMFGLSGTWSATGDTLTIESTGFTGIGTCVDGCFVGVVVDSSGMVWAGWSGCLSTF